MANPVQHYSSTPYARVLFPVDFSPLAWRGLSLAEGVAAAFGVPLQVVHVDTASPDREQEDLTVRSATGETLQVRVIGDPDVAHGIARLAEDEPVLIAMSTHGHTGATEIALGAVCDSVLRATDSPVLATGPHFDPDRHGMIKRVVVCIDATEQSELIVNEAEEWARRLGAEVQLVTAVAGGIAVAGSVAKQQANRLDDLVRELRDHGCTATAQLIPSARPGEAIVDFADQTEGTLIAMSTHSRRPLAHALLGSIASHVARHATSAILMNHRAS